MPVNTVEPLVFVVILNWNLPDYTIACIESVLAAKVAPQRIIVVDNGSTDHSVEALAAHFGSALHLICHEHNLGFAGGMNSGIRYALEQGAVSVLLLNNDTVIDPTMIEILLTAEDALDAPGILGPAIFYHDDPGRLWNLGEIRRSWLPMPVTVRRDPKSLLCAATFQVDYVSGCGMWVRREVFERIGLFDTRYFMYFEDADFCRRARDVGYTVWCVPQAKMWHRVSLTAQRDKPANRYHHTLNQIRFYHEHAHGPSPVLREAYIATKLLKTMLGDMWHGDWNLIAALGRGTVDGYREQWEQRQKPRTNDEQPS